MEDSIFTKIINGDIPSHKVHEDDLTFAFLDIHPIQPGQVLVIPKRPVQFIWDLPTEDYSAVMATAKQVALRLREAFPDKSHVAMQVEGLEVAHAHIKLFAFSTDEEFRYQPDPSAEADHAALAFMAQQLAF